MKLEKKMMVGSTLKAKKCSAKPSPKMKLAPASVKSRKAVTASVALAKTYWPPAVLAG